MPGSSPIRGEAAGIVLESPIDLRFPCPPSGRLTEATVQVTCLEDDPPEASASRFSPRFGRIVSDDVGIIDVVGGRAIHVRKHGEASDDAIAHYVTGPALGLLLHQRRQLVLHASAVAVESDGTLFLGDSGWGKSTIAAAACIAGASFVTDDIARVHAYADQGWVVPGPPWLKLSPRSIEALGIEASACEPIHPGQGKLRCPMQPRPGHVRLGSIFILADGPTTSVEDLGRRDAFVELTRHTYAAQVLEMTDSQGWHAAAVADLVQAVPVRRLTVPDGFEQLSRAVSQVLELQT